MEYLHKFCMTVVLDLKNAIPVGKDVVEMIPYIIGTIGFVIYLIYDANTILWHNRILQKGFLVGSVMVMVGTIAMIWESFPYSRISQISSRGLSLDGIFWIIVCLLGLVGLVYTLFYAIPFDETYLKDSQERLAYTEGMYAICRHPGVLWYAILYFALAVLLGTKNAFFQAIFFVVWNIIYIIYQDRWIFPKTFSNYEDYRKSTPFLIPNINSMSRGFHSCFR